MLDERRLMIAISGASGAIYAQRLIETISMYYDKIYLTASNNAISIIRYRWFGTTDT